MACKVTVLLRSTLACITIATCRCNILACHYKPTQPELERYPGPARVKMLPHFTRRHQAVDTNNAPRSFSLAARSVRANALTQTRKTNKLKEARGAYSTSHSSDQGRAALPSQHPLVSHPTPQPLATRISKPDVRPTISPPSRSDHPCFAPMNQGHQSRPALHAADDFDQG